MPISSPDPRGFLVVVVVAVVVTAMVLVNFLIIYFEWLILSHTGSLKMFFSVLLNGSHSVDYLLCYFKMSYLFKY